MFNFFFSIQFSLLSSFSLQIIIGNLQTINCHETPRDGLVLVWSSLLPKI